MFRRKRVEWEDEFDHALEVQRLRVELDQFKRIVRAMNGPHYYRVVQEGDVWRARTFDPSSTRFHWSRGSRFYEEFKSIEAAGATRASAIKKLKALVLPEPVFEERP